jgi:hypothetical protein
MEPGHGRMTEKLEIKARTYVVTVGQVPKADHQTEVQIMLKKRAWN